MNTTARWGALLVCSLVLAFGAVGVAGAQDGTDPYIGPSPEVDSESVELVPSEVQGAAVEAGAASSAAAPEVQGSTLAFTGGDAVVLLLVGAGAVAAGAALLVTRRRSLA